MTSKWRYFGQSVLTVLSVDDLCVGCRREWSDLMLSWLKQFLMMCLVAVELSWLWWLVASFFAGENARCRWCVPRYLVELCCVVGSRWLLKLIWYASVEWMWWGYCLPSSSCVVVVVRVSWWLICPPSPSRWQALCSLILVLKLLPVSPM